MSENRRDRITDKHDSVDEGVEGNLAQMRASLPKASEAEGFLFDSADKTPSGPDAAKPEPRTNY